MYFSVFKINVVEWFLMYKLPSRIEISWMILAACHSMFEGNHWHSSTSKTEDKLY